MGRTRRTTVKQGGMGGGAVVDFPRAGDKAPENDLPSLHDDELVMLARAGVHEAFDALHCRHHDAVLRFASKQLGCSAMAQDATQNTFLQLFRSINKYRPQGKFRAFLFRVALNECKMSRRRAARRSDAMARYEAETLPNQQREPAQVLVSERMHEVYLALRRLPRKQTDAILLRFAAELSYQEVAHTLGIPVGTVKSRLFNGLAQLHRRLEGLHHD